MSVNNEPSALEEKNATKKYKMNMFIKITIKVILFLILIFSVYYLFTNLFTNNHPVWAVFSGIAGILFLSRIFPILPPGKYIIKKEEKGDTMPENNENNKVDYQIVVSETFNFAGEYVTEVDLASFRKKIIGLLNNGYILAGGVNVVCNPYNYCRYSQALIKQN